MDRDAAAVAELEADTIIPGHGEVLHGRAHLGRVIALLQSLQGRVNDLKRGARALSAAAYIVSANSSRPMSMRRISLVPAPIS